MVLRSATFDQVAVITSVTFDQPAVIISRLYNITHVRKYLFHSFDSFVFFGLKNQDVQVNFRLKVDYLRLY